MSRDGDFAWRCGGTLAANHTAVCSGRLKAPLFVSLQSEGKAVDSVDSGESMDYGFRATRRYHRCGRQRGFTYLGLMFLVVVVTLALSGVATVWHTIAQREREAELLFVGEQISRAIENYYRQSPGRAQLPRSLQDLLLDDRFPFVRRHLRRIYRDPMTGSTEWGLVMLGDRVAGVYSLSKDKPIKFVALDRRGFTEAESYEEWKFVHPGLLNIRPDTAAAATGTVLPGGMDLQ